MIRALLVAVTLAGCAPSPASRDGGAAPGASSSDGIVSTNPCLDAILVRLVPANRIAAISHYSQEPSATSLPLPLARRFRATGGTAEEVIALAPQLVLADSFTPAATLDAYRRAGLRVMVFGAPASIAASVAQVRQVAAAVGAEARGEAMARAIERAARPVPTGQARADTPAALFYIAGDLANGGGTLLDDMMRTAGLRNAASGYGLAFTGTLPAETLVARPPAVIIATGEGRTAKLRARLLPQVLVAAFPRTLVNCGGPSIPPALARLRAIRAGL